jgi:hypothetical protein
LLLLLLLMVVLFQAESSGRYNARTHEFGDSLAKTDKDILKPIAAAPAATGNGAGDKAPVTAAAAAGGNGSTHTDNSGKVQLLNGQPSV